MATQTFTSLSDFQNAVGSTRVIGFDDVDASAEPRAEIAPERYDGLRIEGDGGFFVDEDFEFPEQYVPVSDANVAAPATNRTTVTFPNEAGGVSAFGTFFIDADFPNLGEARLTAFGPGEEVLASEPVTTNNAGAAFLGFRTVDSASGSPVSEIARIELQTGNGDPTVFENEGVVLDDFTLPAQAAGANGAPVAEPDSASAEPGSRVTIDVLSNDSDPDGDSLTVEIVEPPAVGEAVVEGQQIAWDFGAGLPESGSAPTLTYSVADGNGATDTAEVTVTPVSDPGGGNDVVANPPRSETPNLLVLNGESQTLRVPFAADVRGTSAAETVQAPTGTQLIFAGGVGDEVEFAGALSDYELSTAGNQIVVADATTRAEIALNAEVKLSFADGSAAADIGLGTEGVEITLGGAVIDEGFAPADVALDAEDPSELAAGTPSAALLADPVEVA